MRKLNNNDFKVELFFLFQSASQKTYSRLIEPGNDSAFRQLVLFFLFHSVFFSCVFLFVLSFDSVFYKRSKSTIEEQVKFEVNSLEAEQ